MISVKIPRQEITTSTWKSQKTGRDVEIVNFVCEHDGILKMPCQAFGARKDLFVEAMNSGGTVELESLEHNSERNRWDAKVPRGAGSEATYRGKFGGGNRPWTPGGYRGKPQSPAAWQAHAEDTIAGAARIVLCGYNELIKQGCPAIPDDKLTATLLAETRNVWQTRQVDTRENVTFPPGCEPAPATPAENASHAPANGAGAPITETPTVKAYRSMISASANDAMVDMTERQIRADTSLGEAAAVLLGECLARKRALATAGGA